MNSPDLVTMDQASDLVAGLIPSRRQHRHTPGPTSRNDDPGRAGAHPLAARVTGRVVTPADSDWDQARLAWNLAVDQRPELVVQVADAADVAVVVRYAATHRLRVAPQGTGHNAAPLGDLADTVLLRTDRLREILVEPATRIARVGAGVVWGEVTAAVAPYALTALAGSSSDVGVVGYTLGGGYSWLARRYGLAANSVTAVELVTGDGEFHRVDAQHEPELFWAVRGGGANIGVVCALEFELLPLAHVYAGALLFPLPRAGEVMRAYQRWTQDLDDCATTCLRLLRLPPLPELPEFLRGQAFVMIDGAIENCRAEAERLLAPMRELGPVMDSFAIMPTAGLSSLHMDPPAPVPAAGDGLILDELTEDVVQALLAVAGPEAETRLLAVDLRHLGGAVGRAAAGGGALDHLPGQFLLFAVGITPNPQIAALVVRDLRAVREAVAPWTNAGEYLNFRESATGAEKCYPPEALRRLMTVRDQHDPIGVLRANHPLS